MCRTMILDQITLPVHVVVMTSVEPTVICYSVITHTTHNNALTNATII